MPIKPNYCEYIAHTIIRPAIQNQQETGQICDVGYVGKIDDVEGFLPISTATIECQDVNGKKYLITIEEIVI